MFENDEIVIEKAGQAKSPTSNQAESPANHPEIAPETAPEQDRTPRGSDSRATAERPSDTWVPPSKLPMPNPIPGWTFRYIRVSSLGTPDDINVSRKFREGWVAAKASEHPELRVMTDINSPFEDSIQIGGLLLCKMPKEMVEQRNAHFNRIATQQVESVDSGFMNEHDSRMPKYNDSRTKFGRG